jgi:ligand-binding sensor domain-containing protein
MARPSAISSLLSLALLMTAPARAELSPAAEFPPAHLRAVEQPPGSWSEVFAKRRSVRLFWNGGQVYGVERATEDGWVLVSSHASPGWESQRYERGTRFRLVDGEGQASPPTSADSVVTPLQLAQLAGPRGGLPGAEVVDLALDGQGTPWIASLGGGVARVDRESFEAVGLGIAQGLPSERVIAVAPTAAGVWVGTAAGLVHVRATLDSRGEQRFEVSDVIGRREGLQDDYVQALATDGSALWIGTYRGLSRLDAGGLEQVLGPWSVFSLVRGSDERVWVGYEGLLGLPEAEPIEGVDPGLDVYDVEPLPRTGTLLATLQEGVVLLDEGLTSPVWAGSATDGAYALARVAGGYLAAGAEAGLVTLTPQRGVWKRWGLEDGLPSEVVNEVVPDLPWQGDEVSRTAVNASAAWVGTARGLAWLEPEQGGVRTASLSRLPAAAAYTSAQGSARRPRLVGAGGLTMVGPPRPFERRWMERAGGDLVASFRGGGARWIVRGQEVEQQPRFGPARLHQVPGPIRAAVQVRGVPWVGGAQGLFHYLPEQGRFERLSSVGAVDALVAGEDGVVWAIANDVITSIGPDLRARPYIGTHLPLDLEPDEGVVWVGTDNGIDVISIETGQVVDLLRSADRRVVVSAIAADGEGGCWAGTDTGQVIHLDPSLMGGATVIDLAPEHPPEVRDLVALDAQRVWVLTDGGVYAAWRRRAPAP